jgi:hypothetical protein
VSRILFFQSVGEFRSLDDIWRMPDTAADDSDDEDESEDVNIADTDIDIDEDESEGPEDDFCADEESEIVKGPTAHRFAARQRNDLRATESRWRISTPAGSEVSLPW